MSCDLVRWMGHVSANGRVGACDLIPLLIEKHYKSGWAMCSIIMYTKESLIKVSIVFPKRSWYNNVHGRLLLWVRGHLTLCSKKHSLRDWIGV